MFKGLKNVILYWKDADFMINHPVAKKYHKWQRNQRMPEETFFATLIRFKVDLASNHISQVLMKYTLTIFMNKNNICLKLYPIHVLL